MKEKITTLILLFFFVLLVYYQAVLNFFAQDDFILINQFSQNNLASDLINTITFPKVTHWRPIFNLYFTISGNLFGKNYIFYHIFTLLIHTLGGFLIYLIATKLKLKPLQAFCASLIYMTHPAHFVSLYWISGNATVIGFFLMAASFYLYLIKKKITSYLVFILSLFSSEAMVFAIPLFFGYEYLLNKNKFNLKFLASLVISASVFTIFKLTYLTPKDTFTTYPVSFSLETFKNIKYYILRTAGFAESSYDLYPSIILIILYLTLGFLFVKKIKKIDYRYYILSAITMFSGLFPFVLIANHQSPHYMNISIFALSLSIATILKNYPKYATIAFLIAFTIVCAINVEITKNDNWVTKRSKLAKTYLKLIETTNPQVESTIIFSDNKYSTSEEAYFALGKGDAIKFYFPTKNYTSCFTAFQNCPNNKTNKILSIGDFQ